MTAAQRLGLNLSIGTASAATNLNLRGRIAVSGAGIVSPVGVSALQTQSSIRSGITRLQEAPELHLCRPASELLDTPDPAVVGKLDFVEQDVMQQRGPAAWLGTMAALALEDLLRSGSWDRQSLASTGLYLALPLPRSGFDETSAEALLAELHNGAGLDPFAHEQLCYGGRAASFSLAASACERLLSGSLEYALLGGCDSYLLPQWLDELDESYRIKSERNIDGFRPAEAAAFVLLQRRETATKPLGVLSGVASVGDSTASAGDRLAGLVRDLASFAGSPPAVVCDLNGETARARAWSIAASRLGRELGDSVVLEHPAVATGDIGAATGPLLLYVAAGLVARSHAGRDSAVVFATSDDGCCGGAALGSSKS